MKVQTLVSIIIPVYNVAQYLAKCLDSVLLQQRADVEVLAINDGSTDHSGAILKEYAQRYSNVRVFNQPNQGVAAARNVGLDHVHGDYVMFVDPDDWLEPMAVSRLLELMNGQPCDIIGFNYFAVNEKDGTREVYRRIKQTQYYDLSDSHQYTVLFDEHGLKTVVCDCFFSAKLVKKLRFETYPNGEDTLYSFMALLRAHKVLFTSEPFYNYLRRSGTASMTPSLRKEISILNVLCRCSDEIRLQIALDSARSLLGLRLKNWLYPGRVLEFSKFRGQDRERFACEWCKAIKKIYSLCYSSIPSKIIFRIFDGLPFVFMASCYFFAAKMRQSSRRCLMNLMGKRSQG